MPTVVRIESSEQTISSTMVMRFDRVAGAEIGADMALRPGQANGGGPQGGGGDGRPDDVMAGLGIARQVMGGHGTQHQRQGTRQESAEADEDAVIARQRMQLARRTADTGKGAAAAELETDRAEDAGAGRRRSRAGAPRWRRDRCRHRASWRSASAARAAAATAACSAAGIGTMPLSVR